MLTARSFTCVLDGIKCPLIFGHNLLMSFRPKNIMWNFEGLAFMSNVNRTFFLRCNWFLLCLCFGCIMECL